MQVAKTEFDRNDPFLQPGIGSTALSDYSRPPPQFQLLPLPGSRPFYRPPQPPSGAKLSYYLKQKYGLDAIEPNKKKTSAFILYIQSRKADLQKNNPAWGMRDIVSYVGKEWNSLSEDQKKQIKFAQTYGEHHTISTDQIAQWQARIAECPVQLQGSKYAAKALSRQQRNLFMNIDSKFRPGITPMVHFLKEQRGLLAESIPDDAIDMKELAKQGMAAWNRMSKEEQAPYRTLQKFHAKCNQQELCVDPAKCEKLSQDVVHLRALNKCHVPKLRLENVEAFEAQVLSKSLGPAIKKIRPSEQLKVDQERLLQLNGRFVSQKMNIENIRTKVTVAHSMKIESPNTPLYYFDQEKRHEILQTISVTDAKEAFEIIRATFDVHEIDNPQDYQKFVSLSEIDHRRYKRECREQFQAFKDCKAKVKELVSAQEKFQQVIGEDIIENPKKELARLRQANGEPEPKEVDSPTLQVSSIEPANALSFGESVTTQKQTPSAAVDKTIHKHPLTCELQNLVSNQQSILVAQAGLIQFLIQCLKDYNLDLNAPLMEQFERIKLAALNQKNKRKAARTPGEMLRNSSFIRPRHGPQPKSLADYANEFF